MLGELKNQIHPLPLSPIVAAKPWGRSQPSLFYEPDSSTSWGEVFLAIKDFGLISRIANGPLSGKGIHQIGQLWGRELIDPPGQTNWPLPLTIWLERTGDKPGPVRVKTGPEYWRVLSAEPDSWIGAGVDPNQSSWPQKLSRFSSEPGDSHIIPAGLPQALGPGLTVIKAGLVKIGLETLYNWERPQDIWDYQSAPDYKVPITNEPLINLDPPPTEDGFLLVGKTSGFEVRQLKTKFQSFDGGKFSIICPLSGQGRLNSSGPYPNLRLRPGSATIIPSGLGPHSIVSNSSITALCFSSTK
ncbi:MAG: hypothetical protein LBT38_02150 [Deltaproteobacteria bacterium]|jgi:hypothetical protein|nr:hypothetical protein [Deltaproteobacteria bacterium]